MIEEMGDPCENTDREIWRGPDEGCGDAYADSLHITKGGGLGINCGGMVYVKPIREWHSLAALRSAARTGPDVAVKDVDENTPYPSQEAMKAAVELEIHRALGSVQTVVIGKLIQQAIDVALSQPEAVEPVIHDAVARARKDAESQMGTFDKALQQRVDRYMVEAGEPAPLIAPDNERMRRALEPIHFLLRLIPKCWSDEIGIELSVTGSSVFEHRGVSITVGELRELAALSRANKGKDSEGVESESRKQYREAVNKVNRATDREIREASDPTPPDATAQREAIAARRPDYVSDLARDLASDALEDLEGESRAEDRTYYLARWFDAALQTRAGG